ncbi:MAG: hypothetical protein ACK2UH_08655, partial [Candidatus Promineifilaceae bacterium]
TITLVVDVDAAASGTLANNATAASDAFDPNSANNQPSTSTPVNAEADLLLSKAASATSVVAGGRLTYTLSITNDGPSLAANVLVTDTLPAETTLFESSTSVGDVCTDNAGVVTCVLGDLAVDASATITLVVDVDAAASGTLANNATAASDAFDPNSANNQLSILTAVTTEADMSLSKAASNASVVAGEQLTYTLVITNSGPSLATGIRITDTLPFSVSLYSSSASIGGCTEGGGQVVCTLGDLAVDAGALITLVVDVDQAATGNLTNTAQIGSAVPDFNQLNNEDTVVTGLLQEADLSLNKSANSASVAAGERLTYTLMTSNTGPSIALGVQLTDTLPGDATLVSWTGTASGVVCDEGGGEVVCSLGNLPVAGGSIVTLVVEIDPSASNTLVNNAIVGSLTNDSVPDNNTTTLPTTIVKEVDVSVGKRGEPDPVIAGEIITYTVVIFNDGPSDATSVQMIDTLPVSATLLSATRQEGPTYIQRIDSYLFDPPSPDTSGLAYMEKTGWLMASDSEVNEMPIFEFVNLFEITLDGTLTRTGSTIDYSDEPTGLAYDPQTDRIFVSDDTGVRSVYIVTPGADGIHGTEDDDVTSITTSDFGATDPEGVTFDTLDRVLFIADGVNKRIYRVDPGPGGTFNGVPPAGDDLVTSFDVASLGIEDPEGVAFNAESGTLFIGGQRQQLVIETTTDGTLLRTIDLANIGTGVAGLTYAPNSINPYAKSLFASDRGVDNNADP